MSQVQIYETKRKTEMSSVEFEDMISIADAARIRNVTPQAIGNAMTMGDLPEYFMVNPNDLPDTVRAQRFTSRRAVEALPKVRGERQGIKKNVYSLETPRLLPLKHAFMSVFSPVRSFALQ